jgi:hypothetical protein
MDPSIRRQEMREQEALFETRYASSDQSGLHEITMKQDDGRIRRVILEAFNKSEAEEILHSLPGTHNCTIVSIKAILHGIYWIGE